MLMTIERKAPGMLKIGDVVEVVGTSADAAQPELEDQAELDPLQQPVQWYAVHTKPSREAVAADNLRAQGYLCFYPKRLVEIRLPGKQRRVDTVRRPHYPRYVFVGIPRDSAGFLTLELGPVFNTRGVSTVLSDGGGAMPVHQTVMDTLMRRADAEGVMEITGVPAEHLFSVGDNVGFIAECPFAPFRGKISNIDINGMVEVQIDSPMRTWRVEVHYSELLPPEKRGKSECGSC